MKEFKTELEARERCDMINNSQSTVKKDGASRNKGGKDLVTFVPVAVCIVINNIQPLNAMLSPNPMPVVPF